MWAAVDPSWLFCNSRKQELYQFEPHLPIFRVCLYQTDGTEQVKPADVELTFANNSLYSLFSHVENFLNAINISSSNNNYHHLVFIETELTTVITNKLTWAPCQDYKYRANDKANAEAKVKELNEFKKGEEISPELYGAPHVDFLGCERLFFRVLHSICAFTDH